MFVVESYPIAVLLCFCAMICWGSWQNTQVLAGKTWRFELFYWDYAAGILLMSLLAAFTIGSLGSEGRPFLLDLEQADPWYIAMAMLGGVIWNLGTLSLVAAISLAGMAIAFTLGGGLAWVLGIWVQYLDQPKGNATLLAIGSITIVVAVLLSMAAFRRLSKQQRKSSTKGIILSVLVGVMISVYYLFVQRSIDSDFSPASAGRLTNYSAVVFFSLGVFLSTFLYNSYFMKRPVQGRAPEGARLPAGDEPATLLGLARGDDLVLRQHPYIHGGSVCRACDLVRSQYCSSRSRGHLGCLCLERVQECAGRDQSHPRSNVCLLPGVAGPYNRRAVLIQS